MDKINGLNKIIETLQSRISKSKQKSRPSKSPTSKKDNFHPTSKNSIKELEVEIFSKIKQLDKDSPDYKKSAINVFVDEILRWEYSSQITTDPEFNKLKDKINRAFKDNQSLDKGFENILSQIDS